MLSPSRGPLTVAGLVVLVGVVAGCTGGGSQDRADTTPAPSGSAPSSTEATGPTGATTTEDVGTVTRRLHRAIARAGVASVTVRTGDVEVRGRADYRGPGPGSLVGTVRFGGEGPRSAYVARDGALRVEVPPGTTLDTDPPTATTPWGPALAEVDPTAVDTLLQRMGSEAVVLPTATDHEVELTLPSRDVAAYLGLRPHGDLADTVDWRIRFDAQGRLAEIRAELDSLGSASARLRDWQD